MARTRRFRSGRCSRFTRAPTLWSMPRRFQRPRLRRSRPTKIAGNLRLTRSFCRTRRPRTRSSITASHRVSAMLPEPPERRKRRRNRGSNDKPHGTSEPRAREIDPETLRGLYPGQESPDLRRVSGPVLQAETVLARGRTKFYRVPSRPPHCIKANALKKRPGAATNGSRFLLSPNRRATMARIFLVYIVHPTVRDLSCG